VNQDPVTVERIDWPKALPGLHLLQALRLGFRVRVLLPAIIGAMCWLLTASVLHSPAIDQNMPPGITSLRSPVFHGAATATMLLMNSQSELFTKLLLSLLLDLAVIAVVGTAIARVTASEFCTATRVGTVAAFRFSFRSTFGWLLSTALALAIVAAPLTAIKLAGWLISLGTAGSAMVSILWPIVYLMAVLASIAATVCGLAWLLSLAAIGTDQCSGSDALSRGINYVLSHKWKSVVYLTLVVLVSQAAYVIAHGLLKAGQAILQNRVAEEYLMAPGLAGDGFNQTSLFYWSKIIYLIPDAVHLGTFLTGITLAYILLRKAEDAVQIREMDGANSL
jgi:hypothetical protein